MHAESLRIVTTGSLRNCNINGCDGAECVNHGNHVYRISRKTDDARQIMIIKSSIES